MLDTVHFSFQRVSRVLSHTWKFADMLVELCRREKEGNIKPDPDIDIYLKASKQIEEKKT